MTREKSMQQRRAGYVSAEGEAYHLPRVPGGFKEETRRLNEWLKARGESDLSPWRRRKAF